MQNASAIDPTAQLESLLAATDNPTIFTDERGTIIRWNKAAESFYGYAADEVIGQPFAATCSVDPAHDAGEALPEVCDGGSVHVLDAVHRRRDGVKLVVSLTIAPLCDAAGKIVGS